MRIYACFGIKARRLLLAPDGFDRSSPAVATASAPARCFYAPRRRKLPERAERVRWSPVADAYGYRCRATGQHLAAGSSACQPCSRPPELRMHCSEVCLPPAPACPANFRDAVVTRSPRSTDRRPRTLWRTKRRQPQLQLMPPMQAFDGGKARRQPAQPQCRPWLGGSSGKALASSTADRQEPRNSAAGHSPERAPPGSASKAHQPPLRGGPQRSPLAQ